MTSEVEGVSFADRLEEIDKEQIIRDPDNENRNTQEIQKLVSDVANVVLNSGLFIAQLQRQAKERINAKDEEKLAEIDALYKKSEIITSFLEALQARLARKEERTLDFKEYQPLITSIKEHFPQEFLEKSNWNKNDTEILKRTFGSRIEQVTALLNPEIVDIVHLMKDRHEILSLVHEILESQKAVFNHRPQNIRSPEETDEKWDDIEIEKTQKEVSDVAGTVVNIGLLVVQLQRQAEDRQDAKIEGKLAEIDALHKKTEIITSFLEALQSKLSREGENTVDFKEYQPLINALKEDFPHELLEKNEWKKSDAEILEKTFSRRVEQVTRLLNPKMVDVDHLMKDRHEILSLVREILKMWTEMDNKMVRAQTAHG